MLVPSYFLILMRAFFFSHISESTQIELLSVCIQIELLSVCCNTGMPRNYTKKIHSKAHNACSNIRNA